MIEFEVSVVIPVFNAKNYVSEAVKSALINEEVKEVILVYDGSDDGSYEKCLELAQNHPSVKLITHKNRVNRGAAASRNLGIENASYDFVSFLDADDVYLDYRYKNAKKIFESNLDAFGVYEAVGVFFENSDAEREFKKAGLPYLTTVKNKIDPRLLFKAFMKGGLGGHFHIIGIVLKRDVFFAGIKFDEDLKLYEDTFFIFQLAAKFNLYFGNIIEPVALRRVHSGNRITKAFNDEIIKYYSLKEFWEIAIKWANSELPFIERNWVIEKALADLVRFPLKSTDEVYCYILRRSKLIKFAIVNPSSFSCVYFWKILLPQKLNHLLKSILFFNNNNKRLQV